MNINLIINTAVNIALCAMLFIILICIVVSVAVLFAGMTFAAIDWCTDKIVEHRNRKSR